MKAPAMRHGVPCTTVCVLLFAGLLLCLAAGGQVFGPDPSSLSTPDPKARIAVSADGNFGDADDWGATPLTLAFLHHSGYKDRLVHYDYNSTTPSHERMAKYMRQAALEGAQRFGFDASLFHDVSRAPEVATDSLAKQINASSDASKLVVLLAGNTEALWQGVNRAAPEKRKHVYVISHGDFQTGSNNDMRRQRGHSAQDVIDLGVNWVQISDQNKGKRTAATGFATGTMASWEFLKGTPHGKWLYDWIDMVDSDEGVAPKGYRGATGDASDFGLAYYYLTGDQDGNVAKLEEQLKQIGAAYYPRPESEGGWRKLDDPDDIRRLAGMDPEKLAALEAWLRQSDNRDFAAVVIRNGYIALEVERGNSAKTDARRVASVSKAVCATVLAIASEQSQQGGLPRKMSFDDPAFDFIPWAKPLSDPRKAQITVKQLLNHTSGICPEATGARNDGTWEYILGHSGNEHTEKLAFDPGTGCGYSTHGLVHASLVCETVTGKPYDEYAIEALFKPIGCEHWWFQYYEGGEGIGQHPSHGMGMPARDLARIAYCMLRSGRWGDAQVIPEWFVAETGAPSHSVTTPEMRWGLNPAVFSHGWELPANLDGKDVDKIGNEGIPKDARYKPGSGGQLMAFVPSLDLVITRQTGSSGAWQYAEYLRRACAAVLGN